MARTFRQRRQMHAVAELNVTNLLDLAFVLLIIFMIATPLITAEQTVPVNLPIESQSPQTPPDPDVKFESIVVKADGSCMLGSRPVQLDRLAGELATFGGQPKPPVFRIRLDADATAQQFISVMDALKKNNSSTFPPTSLPARRSPRGMSKDNSSASHASSPRRARYG
jgi:biopolymer transport protein ExbD